MVTWPELWPELRSTRVREARKPQGLGHGVEVGEAACGREGSGTGRTASVLGARGKGSLGSRGRRGGEGERDVQTAVEL